MMIGKVFKKQNNKKLQKKIKIKEKIKKLVGDNPLLLEHKNQQCVLLKPVRILRMVQTVIRSLFSKTHLDFFRNQNNLQKVNLQNTMLPRSILLKSKNILS